MSHITKVKTRLKDGQILRQVLRNLGYGIHEGGVISNSRAAKGRAVEFVATKMGHRIGFSRSNSEDGCFEMLADWQVMKKSRNDIADEISQAYSCEKVIQTARCKGYSIIKNTINHNGQIEIVLRKVA